jgi:hypothetical protein
MSAGEKIGLAGLILTALAFIADRLLKPWRTRRVAEAKEREAVALFMSERMQAALRALVGEPGNPEQGLKERLSIGARLARIEEQFHPNGGNSVRDVLDQVHGIAQDNKESNIRLEKKAQEAVVTAGEAARLASIAKQALDDLRTETNARHSENLARFRYLEGNDEASEIQREFFLRVLKNEYDIDLLPDDDDDPPPLHIA